LWRNAAHNARETGFEAPPVPLTGVCHGKLSTVLPLVAGRPHAIYSGVNRRSAPGSISAAPPHTSHRHWPLPHIVDRYPRPHLRKISCQSLHKRGRNLSFGRGTWETISLWHRFISYGHAARVEAWRERYFTLSREILCCWSTRSGAAGKALYAARRSRPVLWEQGRPSVHRFALRHWMSSGERDQTAAKPMASKSNNIAPDLMSACVSGRASNSFGIKYQRTTARIALSANFSSICHRKNLAIESKAIAGLLTPSAAKRQRCQQQQKTDPQGKDAGKH